MGQADARRSPSKKRMQRRVSAALLATVVLGLCTPGCTTDMRPFLELRDLTFEPRLDHISAVTGSWMLTGAVANNHESLTAKHVQVAIEVFVKPGDEPTLRETDIVSYTLPAGAVESFWMSMGYISIRADPHWEVEIIEARSPMF